MSNIRIENPCPVQLFRMKKSDDNYACKSCCKTVIDFRDKSISEIEKEICYDTCGIFYEDQLQEQPRLKGLKKVTFYAMALFSVIGFNVTPAKAQEVDSVKTEKTQKEVSVENENKEKAELKAYKKWKRRHPFKRRRKGRVSGRIIIIVED